MTAGPDTTGKLMALLREPMDTQPSTPNERIADYELVSLLGRGAFGEVWKALDRRDNTDAAVKVFLSAQFEEGPRRDRAAKRFVNGAKAMKKLGQGSNIVAVREGPRVTDGRLWFSMTLFGNDLSRALESGLLSTMDRSQIIDDLITALQYAHAEGVSHHDIKPNNVLLARDPRGRLRAYLSDFDLAAFDVEAATSATVTAFAGTHRYLPPEIATTTEAKRRGELLKQSQNDLYSLSMVAFDVFGKTNELPGSRSASDLANALHVDLDDESRDRVALFIARGVAHDPALRFKSLSELSAAWSARTVPTEHRVFDAFTTAAASIASMVFLEWLFAPSSNESSNLLVTTVGVLAFGMTGNAALLQVLSLTKRSIPGWLRFVRAWAHVRRIRRIIVLSLALIALVSLVVGTRFIHRIYGYEIRNGAGCVSACESSGSAETEIITDEPTRIYHLGCHRVTLACPDDADATTRWISAFSAIEINTAAPKEPPQPPDAGTTGPSTDPTGPRLTGPRLVGVDAKSRYVFNDDEARYGPALALDGRLDTAWLFTVPEEGARHGGEHGYPYILFDLGSDRNVARVHLVPGYDAVRGATDLFKTNRRIRRALVVLCTPEQVDTQHCDGTIPNKVSCPLTDVVSRAPGLRWVSCDVGLSGRFVALYPIELWPGAETTLGVSEIVVEGR